jgi:DNA mismatch repair protein MutL
MPIRLLPANLVNQIAAGEVIERPASVVKELVENAVDAGASRVAVELRDGGKSFISVTDDGHGMAPRELALAIERHATSKLPDDDLVHIGFFGFRGEALPSIGAVGRLSIASRARGAEEGWIIRVEGGERQGPEPTAITAGTRVELRDLFYAVPARLKFLKTARSEQNAVVEILERIAMAHPEVAFSLTDDGRNVLRLDAAQADLMEAPDAARLKRLGDVMGRDFAENAVALSVEREGLHLSGFAGLPTLNRATASIAIPLRQWPAGARPAAAGCHPRCLSGFPGARPASAGGVVPQLPARTRRCECASRQGRSALPGSGHGARPHRRRHPPRHGCGGTPRFNNGRPCGDRGLRRHAGHVAAPLPTAYQAMHGGNGQVNRFNAGVVQQAMAAFAPLSPEMARPSGMTPASSQDNAPQQDYPLGIARAQIFGTYIVAQTKDGMVIVDQHAAHERLVLERMKVALASGGVKRQALLIPEIVELPAKLVDRSSPAVRSSRNWALPSKPSVTMRSRSAKCRPCWDKAMSKAWCAILPRKFWNSARP